MPLGVEHEGYLRDIAKSVKTEYNFDAVRRFRRGEDLF